MGVLDTQRVRRRKENRYTRKDSAAVDTRITGWSRREQASPSRAAYRERTEYRVRVRERGARAGAMLETVAAGAVYLAGSGTRLAGRATRAGARLAWRGLLATLRGLGFAVRKAHPHVKRGAKTSLEVSVQGARASAQLGRRAAVYSAVQLRNQADDMKDGFPDVREWASLARQGAANARTRLVDGMRRRGWLVRPPWRRALRHAGLTAAAIALVWLVAIAVVVIPPAMIRSEAFTVEDIAVVGHDHIDPDEILIAAGVQPGDNLLAIELARVADDVRALEWIEGVQLRRRYPNRLSISVTEREPVLLLADQGLWFVDNSGEVFKRVEPEE